MASALGATTTGMGRLYLVANSKSRWSPQGQPKMAPVPYSMRTKLAIQMGKASPLNGLMTFRPVSKPFFSAVSMVASEVPWLAHSARKAAASLLVLRDGLGDRVFRRDGQEGHPEERVRAGGVDGDGRDSGDGGGKRESDFSTFGAADPVFLHQI